MSRWHSRRSMPVPKPCKRSRHLEVPSNIGGDDWLFGQDGDDSLTGGNGNDILRGGTGNDVLNGSTSTGVPILSDNDIIYGEEGSDILRDYAGDVRLYGGTETDFLHGGSGRDTLVGYGGGIEYDRLTGNDGADVFVLGDLTDACYRGGGWAILEVFSRFWGELILKLIGYST